MATDGGPAFPRAAVVSGQNDYVEDTGAAGMSLRAYFACEAMKAVISHMRFIELSNGQGVIFATDRAADFADALIERLKKE